MDRRSFLKNSALGGTAAAATTLAAPAYAAGHRTLTLVTTWGRGLAGVHDAAQRSADMITAMSDGTLTVDLKAAGELVGAFEVFDAVTSGQADMYHGADYYFVGQHPGYAFFTSVPFGMSPQELMNWYYHGGGAGLHDELGEIFGLKSFLAGNTGPQAGGWFAKEITGPEDFQGLKFRMPGTKPSHPAPSTAPSGSALGQTKRLVSRKSPSSITPLVCTSQARVCRLRPTVMCSMNCPQHTRRSSRSQLAKRTNGTWPSS